MRRALLAMSALAGCASAELDPPAVLALSGPAANRHVQRIVALRPTCGTFGFVIDPTSAGVGVKDAECKPDALDGIAQHVRATLDFVGYQVIDSERLNAVTATHHDVTERHEHSRPGFRRPWVSGTTRTEQVGATFEDATPAEQIALLHEVGADAVLTTRVWVGAGLGVQSSRTNIVVQLRLTSAVDHRMIWVRRCEIQAGGLFLETDEIDRTTRCAAKELPRP